LSILNLGYSNPGQHDERHKFTEETCGKISGKESSVALCIDLG
jgi:hypothetical protein